MKKEEQVHGQRLAQKAKMHSSEGFYILGDPLEGAIFLCFGRDDEAAGEEKSGSLTSITTVKVCGQALLTKILISFTA